MILAGVLAIGTLVGCEPSGHTIMVGLDGLRTFTVTTSINGRQLLCTAGGAIPPLVGTLTGRPAGPEPILLSLADGTVVSVVWPHGFTVRFEPGAALYNDRSERVAKDGDQIVLGQVWRGSHLGTYDDPYIASGIVFDGCYPVSS